MTGVTFNTHEVFLTDPFNLPIVLKISIIKIKNACNKKQKNGTNVQ